MTDAMPFLICLILPSAAVLGGGTLVRLWQPGAGTLTAIQHFTAGLVLGAVAVELCPELVNSPYFASAVVGFVLGSGFMLVIGQVTKAAEPPTGQTGSGMGLLFAVAVDLLVDGLLVGTAITVGGKQGILIAIALTIEAFFLSLSTCETLRGRKAGFRKIFLTVLILAALVAAGVLAGDFFSSQLGGGPRTATLAFATAALLYLVMEELIVEAHQRQDRPMTPVLFFAGFLLIFILQHVLGG